MGSLLKLYLVFVSAAVRTIFLDLAVKIQIHLSLVKNVKKILTVTLSGRFVIQSQNSAVVMARPVLF